MLEANIPYTRPSLSLLYFRLRFLGGDEFLQSDYRHRLLIFHILIINRWINILSNKYLNIDLFAKKYVAEGKEKNT